ncbi:MAG: diacylglycerol kinase family protein [bacterium]|nr:diacylglycerol kinase family protein [bacterium]
MTEETKNEIKEAGKSLKCAIRGLKYAISSERNFQLEIIIALMVIALILIFHIKSWEAIILILMIMWVLTVELVNTIVERVVDILKPRFHPYIGLIKDMMAAVVLFSAVFAIAIGIIVFYPYLKTLLYY